jgi:hypothetical protein
MGNVASYSINSFLRNKIKYIKFISFKNIIPEAPRTDLPSKSN